MKTIALLALLTLTSCTTFTVTQTDDSIGDRTITTRIKATAWFSSAQNLAKIKALQTDKTQSFGADAMSQQGATNVVGVLNSTADLLRAAAEAMKAAKTGL